MHSTPADRPVCACHGEPMYWHKDATRKYRGWWRCTPARRVRDAKHRQTPAYRERERKRRQTPAYRERERKRQNTPEYVWARTVRDMRRRAAERVQQLEELNGTEG